MCMVGQLARTEVESKIDNLIMANKRNADLRMFLVLSTGKARFVNKATSDCDIAPASLEDAAMGFSEYVPTSVKEYKYKPYHVDVDKWPGYPEIGEVKKKVLRLLSLSRMRLPCLSEISNFLRFVSSIWICFWGFLDDSCSKASWNLTRASRETS